MKLPLPAEHGVVYGPAAYSLEAFMDRLDVGEAWLRSRRREGLRVCYVGNRGFVIGDDFLEHLIRSHKDRRGDAFTGAKQ